MHHLDANCSDGSFNSDQYESFQRQIGLIGILEDKDDYYRNKLKKKLHSIDMHYFVWVVTGSTRPHPPSYATQAPHEATTQATR
ncbi:hypothetical protein GQ55_8G010100 [Panicum hallii var. hallii]|uniref:Uncharacterized protein n=1 Tax=Panicum hallii var. hallii TaxID=1504633 RepID=A0A2T7CJD7_9POAL|nr:hypothetical protein GQ55_8G010100 [Panicum hallii var. hallii]